MCILYISSYKKTSKIFAKLFEDKLNSDKYVVTHVLNLPELFQKIKDNFRKIFSRITTHLKKRYLCLARL